MIVKISKESYHAIVQQAQEELPLECCGLLAGTQIEDEVRIEKIYPLTNMDQSREHFSMDPKEQFAAIKQMRAEGHKMIGNYHSHPDTPSRPSEEDKRLAYDESILYGIVSLKNQEPVLKFFKITANQLVEELEYQFI